MELVEVLEAGMYELVLDGELSSYLQPMLDEERDRLESNILADGYVRDPLVVWRRERGEEKVKREVKGEAKWDLWLVEGFTRYSVAGRHRLPYVVHVYDFVDKREVKSWMISNQLGRRNLPPGERARLASLIAMRGPAEAMVDVVSKTARVSRSTARRALEYTNPSPAPREMTDSEELQFDEVVKRRPEEDLGAESWDLLEQPIPPDIQHAFDALGLFARAYNEAVILRGTVMELKGMLAGYHISNLQINERAKEMVELITDATPYCVCPLCKGQRVDVDLEVCVFCNANGWIPKFMFDRLPVEIRKRVAVEKRVDKKKKETKKKVLS